MVEKRFIDEPVNSNLLTGNIGFIDEIEQRTGTRVEGRGREGRGNEE
jgi:hypothetical protein